MNVLLIPLPHLLHTSRSRYLIDADSSLSRLLKKVGMVIIALPYPWATHWTTSRTRSRSCCISRQQDLLILPRYLCKVGIGNKDIVLWSLFPISIACIIITQPLLCNWTRKFHRTRERLLDCDNKATTTGLELTTALPTT